MKITYLAFADDLMLLARRDIISVKIIMDRLRNFAAISGLNINELKSNMFTAGIPATDLETIHRLTNFSSGLMPFRYLGIPLAAEKLKISHFPPFTNQIADHITGWKSASMSYAGRAKLIKSVFQGVECFWLSILPLPTGLLIRSTGFVVDFYGTHSILSLGGRRKVFRKRKGALASKI
ncbi:uncharacterized protein LOC127804583 [Diospyros lotus]|uniref:uncharacterized protein LOC127804583 n=1 Tax=Diospyros lotus TaxID=55363 RepID=UPI00224DCCD0|nr:uncharacterized protein LOC127804583 [Diospyros lotus]